MLSFLPLKAEPFNKPFNLILPWLQTLQCTQNLGTLILATPILTELAIELMGKIILEIVASLFVNCGKIGHVVQKCYHGFDISFHGAPSCSYSSRKPLGNTGSSPNSSSLGGMQAVIATQPVVVDENYWFPDLRCYRSCYK